jgi:hypothetical protein
MDSMDCAACHSSWTNTCVGCHLEGDYDTGNNFSNITGERIVYRQTFAEFVYQSPVPFQLGIGVNNMIKQSATNTKVFYRYQDIDGNRTRVFAFSDRQGAGANPTQAHRALGHNTFLAHSIRGKVAAANEGPRYCVACHLTTNGLSRFGADYATFRTQMANSDYGNLNWNLLRTHIGRNPGNQLDSPMWVHMVAGLGSGVWLFDRDGGANNPLDNNANRYGSDGTAPAATFNPANVYYDLDRLVELDGTTNASSNHALDLPVVGPNRRDGATDPAMAGPMGQTLVRRLTDPATGIVLNAWIDADGLPRGDAPTILNR